jgi:hypothetical protein
MIADKWKKWSLPSTLPLGFWNRSLEEGRIYLPSGLAESPGCLSNYLFLRDDDDDL